MLILDGSEFKKCNFCRKHLFLINFSKKSNGNYNKCCDSCLEYSKKMYLMYRCRHERRKSRCRICS